MSTVSVNPDNRKQLKRYVTRVFSRAKEYKKNFFEEIKSKSFQILMKTLNSKIQGAQKIPMLKKQREPHHGAPQR